MMRQHQEKKVNEHDVSETGQGKLKPNRFLAFSTTFTKHMI